MQQNVHTAEWFEGDSFREQLYPIIFSEDQFIRACDDIVNIFSHISHPTSSLLFSGAAGTGLQPRLLNRGVR